MLFLIVSKHPVSVKLGSANQKQEIRLMAIISLAFALFQYCSQCFTYNHFLNCTLEINVGTEEFLSNSCVDSQIRTKPSCTLTSKSVPGRLHG